MSKKISRRLRRLEATTTGGCGACAAQSVDEAALADKVRRLLVTYSSPDYHRQEAAELLAEADRREAARDDKAAGYADPPGRLLLSAVCHAGADPADGRESLCHVHQQAADLAHRVAVNMAALEAAQSPADLRAKAEDHLNQAMRLEREAKIGIGGPGRRATP